MVAVSFRTIAKPAYLALRSSVAAARTRRAVPTLLERRPGDRRIELGSGPFPTPGYIHIDVDPRAPELDVLAPSHRLPFPDGWADEVRAVHILEHVDPPLIPATLGEWRRALRVGGVLDIHVPNGDALATALTSGSTDAFWCAQVGMFGYNNVAPAGATNPHALPSTPPEHRTVFTERQLITLVEAAGFSEVARRPDDACRHSGPWETLVPNFCLRITGLVSDPIAGQRGERS